MTLDKIKEELASLPEQQQNELAAYLVHLRHGRNPQTLEQLSNRINDRNPENWLSLDQLKEHWNQ